MTSSANRTLWAVVALAVTLAATPAAAQQSSDDASTPTATTPEVAAVSDAAAAPVRAAIAKRWSVPQESVRLQWGRLPDSGLPSTPFRLLGGADGWFVLAYGTGGEAASVRVRAGSEEAVWVAARDLTRGAPLEADDLEQQSRVRWGTPRGASSRVEVGWVLRRAVAQGSVIDRPTAEPPTVVQPGDTVALEWNRGTVALRLTGVALHAARLGDAIRVRVDGRPRPLLGWVDAPGHARIGARGAS